MLPSMAFRDRLWRVDDWFRPVTADGTMPSRRKAVTPRDRVWMLTFLIAASLGMTALFLRVDAGRAFAMAGGLMGLSLVQVVNLYRTRSVGFRLRR
jgi:hypothetical protein